MSDRRWARRIYKDSPPVVTLKRYDNQAIVVERSLSNRLIGIPLLAVGLYFGVYMFISALRQGQFGGALFVLVFAAIFLTLGYFVFSPKTFGIDLIAHTYRESFGWWLFRKETTGVADEFARIVLRSHNQGLYSSCSVVLEWKDSGKEATVLSTLSNRDEALRQGKEIAAALRLPLIDIDGKVIADAASSQNLHFSSQPFH